MDLLYISPLSLSLVFIVIVVRSSLHPIQFHVSEPIKKSIPFLFPTAISLADFMICDINKCRSLSVSAFVLWHLPHHFHLIQWRLPMHDTIERILNSIRFASTFPFRTYTATVDVFETIYRQRHVHTEQQQQQQPSNIHKSAGYSWTYRAISFDRLCNGPVFAYFALDAYFQFGIIDSPAMLLNTTIHTVSGSIGGPKSISIYGLSSAPYVYKYNIHQMLFFAVFIKQTK